MTRIMKIGDLPAGASVYISDLGVDAPLDLSSRRIVCEICGGEVRAGTKSVLIGTHGACSEKEVAIP